MLTLGPLGNDPLGYDSGRHQIGMMPRAAPMTNDGRINEPKISQELARSTLSR